jgi:hypothetical protein
VQLRYFEIFVAMHILENTYLTEYLLCQMDSRQLRKNWVQKLQFNVHKIHILRTLAMMTKDAQARQTRSPYYRDFEEEEDLLQVNEVQTWGITSD